MATVTNPAGTAARRLFNTRYLPSSGSTATTATTSFRVEESRLLVAVYLTYFGFAAQGKCFLRERVE